MAKFDYFVRVPLFVSLMEADPDGRFNKWAIGQGERRKALAETPGPDAVYAQEHLGPCPHCGTVTVVSPALAFHWPKATRRICPSLPVLPGRYRR